MHRLTTVQKARRWRLGRRRGYTLSTYALVVGFGAVAVIGSASQLGFEISDVFDDTAEVLEFALLPKPPDGGIVAATSSKVSLGDFETLQSAIDAAGADGFVILGTGTFEEAVTVNDPMTILGQGDGTVLDGGGLPGSTVGIQVTTQNVTISGLAITGHERGIRVREDDASGLEIENVDISDCASAGISIDRGARVDGFTLTGSSIVDCEFGLYVAHEGGSQPTRFLNGLITNSDFTDNDGKGVYLEAGSNLTFANLSMVRNGNVGIQGGKSGAAIDINLYSGAYSDITIRDTAIVDSGWSTGDVNYNDNPDAAVPTPTLAGGLEGAALIAKGRAATANLGDGSLTGLVVDNVDLEGVKSNGLSIGLDVRDLNVTGGSTVSAYDPKPGVFGYPLGVIFWSNPLTASYSLGDMEFDGLLESYIGLANSPDVTCTDCVFDGVVAGTASASEISTIRLRVFDALHPVFTGGPGTVILQVPSN